jgi:hypothetical protein
VIRLVRQAAGVLFIDWRTCTETVLVGALTMAYFLSTNAHGFDASMSSSARAALYASLAGTSAALLGFVLAALAVLVALPGGDRIEALRTHPKWPRVPSAYVRASLALLASVVVCTLGIVLDGGSSAWQLYEAITVVVVAFALVRVLGSVVALDQILSVASTTGPAPPRAIIDP